MTPRFLLDTGVVSAPMLKNPDPLIVKQLEAHVHESVIAAPVWHELIYGCSRLPAGHRRRALGDYLRDVVQAAFPVLPYDEAAADWHGRERARLESAGWTAPFTDGQIAAIAHVHRLTLVTANTRDFTRFSGLDVTNWTKSGRHS